MWFQWTVLVMGCLYVVLWGAVNLVSNLTDLALTSALQRAVPSVDNEEQAHAAVNLALIVAVLPALLIAAAASWQADQPEDSAVMIQADKTLPYETVVNAMGELQKAGVKRVALGVKSAAGK